MLMAVLREVFVSGRPMPFLKSQTRIVLVRASVVDLNRVGVISGWLLAVATLNFNRVKWVTTQKVKTQILFNRVDFRV